MRSLQIQRFSLLIAVAVVLSAGIGAALEHKLGLLSAANSFLTSASSDPLPSLAIESDPNLERISLNPLINGPSKGELAAWQASTRALIIKLGGSDIVPDSGHVAQYRTLQEKTLPDGTMQALIAFKTFDGSEIPAYLHVPKAPRPVPGILVIPGHVKEGESGIEQLANEENSYQHAAARRLAEKGYVTITPELRGFGYLGEPYHTEHRIVAYNAFLNGTSYKWIVLRDLGYAMALLRQLKGVDSSRTGITGASLGGELAVYYSALDPQVDAVAFQSFGGSQGLKQARRGSRDDQPHYCHTLPGIDTRISQEQWFWLLAPRPVQGVRGSQNHPFDATDQALYGEGWSDLSVKSRLELTVADGGHEYFIEPASEFFARSFGADLP